MLIAKKIMLYLHALKTNLIPLHKHIYYREDSPNIIVKEFKDLKKMDKEYLLHWKAQKLVSCPKIIEAVYENQKGYLCMERMYGKTLDAYDEWDITSSMWAQIHQIVKTLYLHNIHYIAIQPKNFILENGTNRIFVIDFGSAEQIKVNRFLNDFIDKEFRWNA